MSVRAHVVESLGTRPRSPAAWSRRQVAARLRSAGLTLDGPHVYDPQIHRERALRRLLFGGTLGAGESYVDGDWDCEALDEFIARLVAAGADTTPAWRSTVGLVHGIHDLLANPQRRAQARADIRSHYDIGNDLYTTMLGRTMAYSCGYWRHASSLDDAQDAKHELVCEKLGLGLEPGMRVLDIGCGWGGFAKHAAERHGASVVGITISPAQAEFARMRCAGLPVEIRLDDYRDVCGRFDRVVSIGMFEHVGPRNYRTFFETVARLVEPDGLVLLHTIGGRTGRQPSDAWMAKYIFPHAVLPSAEQCAQAFAGYFVLEDWHNFGADYDRTLMAWHRNVARAWPDLASRYSPRFHRLWRYYLLTCAGLFRARVNHLWQLVLSPHGVAGGYRRPAV